MASAPFEVPAGHVLLSSSHLTSQAGAYSFAEGRTGDGVSALTLNLDDGSKVQATIANGWFVAWWPGTHAVTSVDVTTPAGTSTQTFAPGSGPGAAPRSGYSFGSSSGGGAGGGASTRSSQSSYSLSQ
jgi:hypothetical protein